MKRENGFTLMTLMFLLGLGVIVALLAFKIAPTYMDYFAVKSSLENIIEDGTDQTNPELRKTFAARLNVNFIRDISASDLEIDRTDDILTLSVPINRTEHLFGGISVTIDLEAKASAPIK